MKEVKKDQYVSQNDFREVLLEIKEQMHPLANLDAMIFRNILKIILSVLIPLGGALIWWIDRELDQNQIRIAALEAINFTPSNQILLERVDALLNPDPDSESERKGKL